MLTGQQIRREGRDPRAVAGRGGRLSRERRGRRVPPPHARRSAWCSMTVSSIGGRSNTCRRSLPITAASCRSSPQPRQTCGTCTRTSSGSGRCTSRNPGSPGCLPGLRPEARRSDRGAGFTNASELGGFEEFCEFFPNRASNSPTRAANSATRAADPASFAVKATISSSRSASRTSNCSTEGTATGEDNDESATKHQPCGGSRSTDRRSLPQIRPRPARHAVQDLNGYVAWLISSQALRTDAGRSAPTDPRRPRHHRDRPQAGRGPATPEGTRKAATTKAEPVEGTCSRCCRRPTPTPGDRPAHACPGAVNAPVCLCSRATSTPPRCPARGSGASTSSRLLRVEAAARRMLGAADRALGTSAARRV